MPVTSARFVERLPRACRRHAGPDEERAEQARARCKLTKPAGALGRLETLARWAAAWQGRRPPRAERIQVVVFAGNHGVTARGVSAYPAAVTAQMVANFEAGGAAINQLCGVLGAALTVVPLDLDTPTEDMTEAPALGEAACIAALEAGSVRVDAAPTCSASARWGSHNTAGPAAMAAALCGGRRRPPGWGREPEWIPTGSRARRGGRCGARAARRSTPRSFWPRSAASAGGSRGDRGRRRPGAGTCAWPVLLDGFACTAAAAVIREAAGLTASITPRWPTARPSPGTGACWRRSRLIRCSISACVWVKPRAPRSPPRSCAWRSRRTTAWRLLTRPGSAAPQTKGYSPIWCSRPRMRALRRKPRKVAMPAAIQPMLSRLARIM